MRVSVMAGLTAKLQVCSVTYSAHCWPSPHPCSRTQQLCIPTASWVGEATQKLHAASQRLLVQLHVLLTPYTGLEGLVTVISFILICTLVLTPCMPTANLGTAGIMLVVERNCYPTLWLSSQWYAGLQEQCITWGNLRAKWADEEKAEVGLAAVCAPFPACYCLPVFSMHELWPHMAHCGCPSNAGSTFSLKIS